jgi:hypothetical protein
MYCVGVENLLTCYMLPFKLPPQGLCILVPKD